MRERSGWRRDEGSADPRTNTVVKLVLRSGLGTALTLLLAGLVVQLAGGDHVAVEVRMFDLLGPRRAGETIMGVGVLVLVLTPVAGILSLVTSWAGEHDPRFVAIGSLVLLVLVAAVVVGLAG